MLTEIIKYALIGITNLLVLLVLVFFFVRILNLDPVLANGAAYFFLLSIVI